MALKSKKAVIGTMLASLVVIASLIFLGFVLKDDHHGEGHHHDHKHGMVGHDEMHDEAHSAMHKALGDDAQGIGIVIENGYARANGASAKAGAVFMVIKNFTDADDRLIAAKTDVAQKAALHSHTMDASGVMKMGPIKGGLVVQAQSQVELKRGGSHVMLMGLNRSLNQGDVVTLTLTFENAGDLVVEVPVDLKR